MKKKMADMTPEEIEGMLESLEAAMEQLEASLPEDCTWCLMLFGPSQRPYYRMTSNSEKGRTASPVRKLIRGFERITALKGIEGS